MSRELRRVLSALPADGVVVEYGGTELAAAIAQERREVIAVVPDALPRDAGRAEIVVSDTIPCNPAAVVLKPTGFEGIAGVRAMLAEAHRALAPSGVCVLVVHTRRGAARLIALMDEVFGSHEVLKGGGMRVAAASKTALGDAATDRPPVIEFEGLSLATGPAQFSRTRVDAGARLLLETVRLDPGPGTVVDLGCGYGVIGLAIAKRRPDKRVVLVDVNAAAVRLARENALRNGVEVEVVLSDGIAGIRTDDVVSNFPLHVPREAQHRILLGVHAALRRGGRLWICALEPYDLRTQVASVFGDVDTLREAEGYRILRAKR